jgi:hypothetical protein
MSGRGCSLNDLQCVDTTLVNPLKPHSTESQFKQTTSIRTKRKGRKEERKRVRMCGYVCMFLSERMMKIILS